MKVNKIHCQPIRPFIPSFKNTETQPENNANPGFKGVAHDTFEKLNDPMDSKKE